MAQQCPKSTGLHTEELGVLTGAPALADFCDQFLDHMGPAVLRLREEPRLHHDRARLRWEILLGDGTSFAAGTDVVHLDGDGRISAITAFLDRTPEGFYPGAHH
ncbi:hypothetical protein ACFQLX_13685 [Streptomyces polyrhachis]|uniref:Isomerase n=1 Tax=Streptomyces polyrhachis TaxID=1282885 RepID=A0ABW2GIH0_9ACTN